MNAGDISHTENVESGNIDILSRRSISVSQEQYQLQRNGEEKDGQDESDENYEVTNLTRYRLQLFQLLRKRYLVATRDLKGLFFQILFPILQIVLILAILTVVINPAGKRLDLTSRQFVSTPEMQLSGSSRFNWTNTSILQNTYAYETYALGVNTSSQISNVLRAYLDADLYKTIAQEDRWEAVLNVTKREAAFQHRYK